jgi:hypothetical protein
MNRARKFLSFSAAAYCSDPRSVHGGLSRLTNSRFKKSGVEDWSCSACQQYPHTTASVFNSIRDGIGFVGYESDENEIIVAFSGTNPFDIAQWIDDLAFVKTTYPSCSGCHVHQGFYKTYLSVRAQVRNLTKAHLSAHPSASITVTGHSLGAALAVHALADFTVSPIGGAVMTTAYTFGMPRVGDEAFERWYASAVPGTFRLVHRKDPVPHLPPLSFGFHHMPFEVFYETDPAQWKQCSAEGEDSACSDRYAATVDVCECPSTSSSSHKLPPLSEPPGLPGPQLHEQLALLSALAPPPPSSERRPDTLIRCSLSLSRPQGRVYLYYWREGEQSRAQGEGRREGQAQKSIRFFFRSVRRHFGSARNCSWGGVRG